MSDVFEDHFLTKQVQKVEQLLLEMTEKDIIKQQTQRIHDLNNKLKSIDNMMVERIKHAKWCKEAASSNTSRKREGYREHALSEALGEIRKITKGKT